MTSMEKLASLLCMLFVLQGCHGSFFNQLKRQIPGEGGPELCTSMMSLMHCAAPLQAYEEAASDALSFFDLVDESTRKQFCRDTEEAKACARANILDPSCDDYMQTITKGLITVQEFVCGSRGQQMLRNMAGTPCVQPDIREQVSFSVVMCSMPLERVNMMGGGSEMCSALASFRQCILGAVESSCGQASGDFTEELYDLAIDVATEVYPMFSCGNAFRSRSSNGADLLRRYLLK